MIKVILCSILLGIILAAHAQEDQPIGFLWYNLAEQNPRIKSAKPAKLTIPFNRLSFTQRDAILHFYTLEALHKARYTKSIADMRTFLSLQHYWLQESSKFAHTFQKTLLTYPQYDYTVTHPINSNLGTKLIDEMRSQYRHAVINKLAKTHGLLFFYRGHNTYDQKQIPIIQDFCQHFNLTLIPVSVDGVTAQELPRSRQDQGHASALGVRYFPAILLVNPHTHKTVPVAYGFTTQDNLATRLVNVATNFQGADT